MLLRLMAVAVGLLIMYMASSMLGNSLTMDLAVELARANLTLPKPRVRAEDLCRVATQGKLLVADSKGRVCERFAQDPQTKCCVKRVDLRCEETTKARCYEFYEQCVGCCMAWADFDECSLGCRTNSGSLNEHQEYRDPPEHRHCFDPDRRATSQDERRGSMQQTLTPQPTRWPTESPRPSAEAGDYEWLEI